MIAGLQNIENWFMYQQDLGGEPGSFALQEKIPVDIPPKCTLSESQHIKSTGAVQSYDGESCIHYNIG